MINNQFKKVVLCNECGILNSIGYHQDITPLYPIAFSHKRDHPDHLVVVGEEIPHRISFDITIWISPEHKETVQKQLIDIAHKYSPPADGIV